MTFWRALTPFLLAVGLAVSPLAPAADPPAQAQAQAMPTATASACREGAEVRLAQGLPLDCCKGHKGICGCRAGRIVCCDGTVSKDPNCTCHADSGLEL